MRSLLYDNNKKNNYNFVDLGLPSGTLWADRNIGAETPYDSGLYFQWGDTVGYTAEQFGIDKVFNYDTHKFGNYDDNNSINHGISKYNYTDGKIILNTEDDAAYINTNGKFKMPTVEQYEELINNTVQEYYTENKIYLKIINKNDSTKFIIFPASSYAIDDFIVEDSLIYGYWWSNTRVDGNIDYAECLAFDSEFKEMNYGEQCRIYGFPIRGVLVQ